MKKIELLAPAGDINKLKTAVEYGADAVYLGGESFGLRKASKNFSMEDIKWATDYLHERGKKIHVTLNIIPHNHDMEGVEDYIKELYEIGVDALIVADPGMFMKVKEVAPDFPIHISTQGSVTNVETVKFWQKLGAERVVMARELSLKEVADIIKEVGDSIEVETFAHGAMCMSYSGRCLLSNYMTGRDANMGDCAQPCRYKYHLVEEKRPGEYFPIEEHDEGTFIMNSKDLCMIEHIDEMIEAGIASLKIEGRVKSEYYLATVIRSYRMAIDAYYRDPENYKYDPSLLEEIKKVSHRDFTTGFFFGQANENSQVYKDNSYIRGYDFVGIVLDYDEDTKIATIEQRNRVFVGEEIEIFGPGVKHFDYKIEKMLDDKDREIDVANKAKQIFKIKIDQPIKKGFILRRENEE
ncbi:MAG: U32 family peptidase [Peptoniphilus harei]|uniref:peptidase U32 family protein n=1 Tax=Peptoniphilus harei TaxID=54005 RepID=UPI00254A059A|nr:U32 family peptidase [Peptoniphilus harei]MDK7755970.1 U32 family peptidase [Peptoniphilus harei]MDK7761735.1 U32 family peptidase [Peptoniphilus harei]MDK8271394.1 U32 family peptidase [Peptoniphilus harei]MDK8339947.1 U32 family peptidase [Peptoniphilus harei]MDU7532635.1 U32 family peptidase [Peptoniphilus harei]